MAASQHYFMKWNNYQTHMANIFLQLYLSETLVDVTVCADGVKIQAHRVILSACSPYFQDILADAGPNPILLLTDISSEDMKAILDFIYHGELNISADRCSSLLKAANSLQISGLMEVSKHHPDLGDLRELSTNESLEPKECQDLVYTVEMSENNSDHSQEANDSSGMEVVEIYTDVADTLPTSYENDSNLQIVINTDTDVMKKKKIDLKRDYDDSTLSAALQELSQGRALVDVSNQYSIPRSTLYSRAKAVGIAPFIERKEYTPENVTAAVQAVAEGSSLKKASDMYGIPKTVLWRKVQRDVGRHAIRRRMRKYTPQVLEAACDALLAGENITKVSALYKIPTSTLFREKQRLVKEGKLPETSISTKRSSDILHQLRLRQAVAACKEGKMSQALASTTFKVPKTTIWRRLQKSMINDEHCTKSRRNKVKPITIKTEYSDENTATNITEISESGEEFHFSEVVPMTYLNVGDGTEINETSLIILTPSNEAMDLQDVVVEEEITEISAEDAQNENEEDEIIDVEGHLERIEASPVIIDASDLIG